MEDIKAAGEKGIVQRALDILFKGLDEMIRSDIAEKEKLEREGKLGLRYKFKLEDHPKGRVVAEIWPIKGQKDLWYVDRVYGSGQLEDGQSVPEKLGDTEWKPTTIEGENIIKTINEWLTKNNAGVGSIGKPENDEGEEISVKDRNKQSSEPQDTLNQDAEAEEVEECTKVRARLQKIAGSTEITYTAITATCDPATAMNMLCDAMDCEELCNDIGEEPVIVEVIDNGGDDLDVEFVDDIDISSTPQNLEQAKQKLMTAIQEFIDFVDVYCVNFGEDQQETLAQWSEELADERERLGEGVLE